MDPVEIGKLLVPLAALAGIYMKLQSAMRQMAGKGDGREITNNPLIVQGSARPATMDDVDLLARRVTKLEEQIIANARHAEDSSHETLKTIYDLRDRIDDKLGTVAEKLQEIGRAVGRLEGQT
jgi:hypothetical protein